MKSLFYQPIFIEEDEQNICFWSDTHFNHKCEHWPIPLWKHRGFNSIEEHNEGLIQRWNEKTNENTIFFHLGDFIFGYNSIIHFKTILKRVKFKDLYIMPGNHCSGWKQVFEEQRSNIWHVESGKRVIFVPNYVEVYSKNQSLVLSHYPILCFNGQSKGSICLYGHVHGNLIKNDIGKLYSNAKTLEVTVESTPFPISLTEIKHLFQTRKTISFDQHPQQTLIN